MQQSTRRILVTGSNGFLGRALCVRLKSVGRIVRASARRRTIEIPEGIEFVRGELSPTFDWSFHLESVDTILHTAARVHVTNDRQADSLKEFRYTNVDSTLNLARQAAQAGVRRLIFISSLGVNGAVTSGTPFGVNDAPSPHSPYAISKYEAEIGLQALAMETGMEIVIIRAPLVYGVNAPGNFGSLMRWVSHGVPLPLGAVTHNRRSLVSLDNLVDLILTCIEHPKAANQILLVSDGEDLSTTELLRKMGQAMNRPVRLLPVPPAFLAFAARLLGMQTIAQSLLGSLQVDMSKTCELLSWKPPISVDEGLQRAVEMRM